MFIVLEDKIVKIQQKFDTLFTIEFINFYKKKKKFVNT